MTQIIMIVEDDYENLEYMRSALGLDGYTILSAENGEQALALLQANHDVSLFLIDILMPMMNGIELAKRLRALPQHTNTPIVAISAIDNATYRNEMTALQVCIYLVKPVRMADLRQAVHDCLTE